MKRATFGNPAASIVLVQMADDHDLFLIENEVSSIRDFCGEDFLLVVYKVNRWNQDLSPWPEPPVFGNEEFGDGAAQTLKYVLDDLAPVCAGKSCFIGGYSLAGLFALWSVYQTDLFEGAACASPSVWFPGFTDYMMGNELRAKSVYLSLGDREERTRNQIMSTVGNRIRNIHEYLLGKGVECTLEWNQGNHFTKPAVRTAKAFSWVMKNAKKNHS